MKIKDSLRKVGRAAKRFLHQNIAKRRQIQPQRCELQLTGLPEETDQVIVTISITKDGVAGENHSLYFPPFLDSQLTLPKALLPVNAKGDWSLCMTVYAMVGQKEGDLKDFSKVHASGRSTLVLAGEKIMGVDDKTS